MELVLCNAKLVDWMCVVVGSGVRFAVKFEHGTFFFRFVPQDNQIIRLQQYPKL